MKLNLPSVCKYDDAFLAAKKPEVRIRCSDYLKGAFDQAVAQNLDTFNSDDQTSGTVIWEIFIVLLF